MRAARNSDRTPRSHVHCVASRRARAVRAKCIMQLSLAGLTTLCAFCRSLTTHLSNLLMLSARLTGDADERPRFFESLLEERGQRARSPSEAQAMTQLNCKLTLYSLQPMIMIVGLQPTVIVSRAPHLLLAAPAPRAKNRGRASPVNDHDINCLLILFSLGDKR